MASELGVQTIQHTNGTDAMTIDSSGRILTPARPAFSVYGDTDGSSVDVTSGPADVNIFNVTDFNIGSCISLSSGVATFTAPIAGLYQFNSTVLIQSVTTATYASTYIYVYEGGSTARYSSGLQEGAYKNFLYRTLVDHGHNDSDVDYFELSNSAVIQLSASDTVKVKYEVGNDTTTKLRRGCRFNGFLVG